MIKPLGYCINFKQFYCVYPWLPFVRSHLHYGNIIYDQAYKESFHQKLESIKWNAALAVTGAIRGTSKETFFQELGLESLQKQHW